MGLYTYFLVKKTFWDQLQEEVREVVESFLEIFEMFKELTYGNLEKLVGPDIALLALIIGGTVCIMLGCLAIINR